jgi:hypothetical protein
VWASILTLQQCFTAAVVVAHAQHTEPEYAQAMTTWITLARRRDIVKRSLKVAVIVGTILIMINYGDRLVRGSIGGPDLIKMMLTYCVPYCVSTYAAVSAILAARAADGGV